jgi:alanine dehydrogenase
MPDVRQLGVIGTSRKENEHRLPIHPLHFDQIPTEIRPNIRFERGYGDPFAVSDEELARRFGGVAEREALLGGSDVVLLPKPLPADLLELGEGAVLWGWPHCVQQTEITQAAIDRKLTLIAWEAMFIWRGGTREMHVFDRNNEMAGYCGVVHALGLSGLDGSYGPPASAAVLSHGSVSRGAIHALLGRGFHEIRVYTQRPPWAVHDKVPGCRYGRMVADPAGGELTADEEDGQKRPLVESLAEVDVIVNGILQDTDRPLMFLRDGEERRLAPGALIVDVSCDLEMGFPFARPTSFAQPAFDVGHVKYYAVDHTPSYLWRSATWELSRVVVPHLETVLGGPPAWERNETVKRAIEISDGEIRNPKVLNFQNRAAEYPHPVLG